MPKGKKKQKHNTAKIPTKLEPQLNSDDESVLDNESVISGLTESKFGSDDNSVDLDQDETTSYDNFEDKLDDAIEGTNQKSAKGRQNNLLSIQKSLTSRYLFDFINTRKLTVFDMLERSLKRGKGDEQGLAAILAAMVCVHLGANTETEQHFADLLPLLLNILNDPTVAPVARAKCATTLGVCCFIHEIEAYSVVMDGLYGVFSASFLKGNGAVPSHSPEMLELHSSAVVAWSLLLTICPMSSVRKMIDAHLYRLPQLLESTDVDLRIAAGETIAICYELGRKFDEDFEGEDIENLCEKLKQLATDCHKFRAKKDRRQQRSSFRDILRTVETGVAPDMQVKFGREILDINTWCRKRQYDSLCQIMGSAMNLHLTENDLLRDIFELGLPLSNQGFLPKINKLERHYANIAADKVRTVTRGRLRDKRADVL